MKTYHNESAGQSDGERALAARFLLDRLREVQRELVKTHIELQKRTGETVAVRKELSEANERLAVAYRNCAAAQVGLEASRAELAAIINSRGFRLLERLRAIGLRWLPRARRHVLQKNTTPPPCPDAAPTPQDVAPSIAPQETAASKYERELFQAKVDADVAFSPSRWSDADEPASADSRFVNLIILSACQRAGSTLLQRICNAREGTLIWGEHGGLLTHFREMYTSGAYMSSAASEEREEYFRQGENPNLWIASMSPELSYVRRAIIHSARSLLNTLYSQHCERYDILGFKEVAYGREEIELLRRCYPEAHLLLLVRHPLNAWKSTPRDWCPRLDRWIDNWNEAVECFLGFAANDNRCHLIRYRDLVLQDSKVLATLGEVAKVTPEQVAAVMSHKIGSTNAGISASERHAILSGCRKLMLALGYSDDPD